MEGDILLRAGLVGPEDLARAQELRARQGGSLGRALESLGAADPLAVVRTLAAGLNLDWTDLTGAPGDGETGRLVPADVARKHLVIPLEVQGRSLRLGMAEPLNYDAIRDVEFLTGMRVVPVVCREQDVLDVLDRLHGAPAKGTASYDLLPDIRPEGSVEAAEPEYEVVDPAKLAKDASLTPIVRLVNMILSEAARAEASDVHAEPQESFLLIRQRVDGILQDVLKVSPGLKDSAVSRLKVISGMDIAERRRPQDGRCRLRMEGRRIDLRVSTLPTQFGEKVVIRLLDSANAQISLEKLGFEPDVLDAFRGLIGRPQGLVLVAGPTGSGKTSTLYAALNALRSPTRNIITVEDPIEYNLPGLNQVQINPRAGLTFAAGLRSILRQDPNVVLLGEIRDAETAEIALDAAQTGHLLLSTLHTNDAAGAVTRLLDLGVEEYLLAASLVGVLAQRLVRRPCPACARESAPRGELVARLGGPARLPDPGRWMAATGCDACRTSGYRGRVAVHELLVITDDLRERIHQRAAELALRAAARGAGMRTMAEDGIGKAARGLTTLEELIRVVPAGELAEAPAAAATAAPPQGGAPFAGAGAADLAGAAAHADPRPAATGGAPRVLVAEDSPTVCAVVKYFLDLEGFTVLLAEDGTSGLDLARRELPDVVVTDVNMPGLNGMDLVRALRDDPATRRMAILMQTSDASVESETRGLDLGADDYIVKPVEPRRLASRVKAALARARGRPSGEAAGAPVAAAPTAAAGTGGDAARAEGFSKEAGA
jgi:type IV pilus assembly protein PilB